MLTRGQRPAGMPRPPSEWLPLASSITSMSSAAWNTAPSVGGLRGVNPADGYLKAGEGNGKVIGIGEGQIQRRRSARGKQFARND
jgi:hypothetical protein